MEISNDNTAEENNNADNPANWFSHLSDNFSSIYFGKVPEHLQDETQKAVSATQLSNVVQLLVDPKNKELRVEVLALLKRHDARDLLVRLLEDKAHNKHRKELMTACWESGLDFSAYLVNFARYIPASDLAECIEIATVIDEMHGPFEAAQLSESMRILNSQSNTDKALILEPAIFRLQAAQN
ncbi:MAG: hypothetical protein ACK5Z2_07980 [Bacteroidota bacterium]|jgi:hypothetical protein